MKIKKFKAKTTDDDDYDDDDDTNYNPKKWYQQISSVDKDASPVTDQTLIELKDEAKKCLDNDAANYNIKNSKTNSNFRWMKTVMNKGTVADKVAANILLIQENPVCNLETIRNLIGMVKVGKKKECILVIENLTDLFLSDLLRKDSQLKTFQEQPLAKLSELSSGNAVTRKKYLCHWYFEHELKEAFNNFVVALNKAAHDSVENNKEKAIAAMSKLLAGNPEQEKNLLAHVVNKLGDPSQKVASKAMFCLSQVLKEHTNMQGVTLAEIEKLLFRSNIGKRAQYYSLCFLSQFFLCLQNHEVANKLIDVYFSFFKKCVKEGEVDSKMMSVLLIGVNRAYPYAKIEMEKIAEHIDTMYRIVHVANFNVSLNALCLLYQVSQNTGGNDRFYNALYKKLLDLNLPTTPYQAILLNLVYKALTKDSKRERIVAFIKRLLQIATNVQPSFACAILYLVSHLMFSKQGRELNVTLLELKSQNASSALEDEDDEEKYQDIKDEEDVDEEKGDLNEENSEGKPEEKLNGSSAPGWFHRSNAPARKPARTNYDSNARNPTFSKAYLEAYNELSKLKNHFHPSVRLFAENIVEGKKIIYSGDPLKDFTLIRFLDRFVFKNPKKPEEISDSVNPTFARRKLYVSKGVKALPVFSNSYLQLQEENIPVDELFLYTYLQRKYKEKPLKENDEDDESDLDSVASDEFEEMLGKMSGFKDALEDEKEDVDFMGDIKESQSKKKEKKSKKDEEDEVDSDEQSEDEDNEIEDMDGELSDAELEDMDLEGDDDDDDEDLVFDSSENEEEEEEAPSKKKRKRDSASIFAAAEEFAALLEEEGASKRKPGSSHQVSNADKAAAKQLDWEEKRNRWIKGYNTAVGGKNSKRRKNNFKNKSKK